MRPPKLLQPSPTAETMWVVTILFVLTYVLIVTDRINRSIIAMLGAGAMVVSGVLSQDEAIRGIDFNTIALLTGMMVLVAIARRCGMFEYVAVWSAKRGRAQPWAMLAMLSLVTAVVSAFLDNVTTVLLIAPVTLSVTRLLEAPPYPFLFAEVFASNIGGTATLIGDPPNIIIGSGAGHGARRARHDHRCAADAHLAGRDLWGDRRLRVRRPAQIAARHDRAV